MSRLPSFEATTSGNGVYRQDAKSAKYTERLANGHGDDIATEGTEATENGQDLVLPFPKSLPLPSSVYSVTSVANAVRPAVPTRFAVLGALGVLAVESVVVWPPRPANVREVAEIFKGENRGVFDNPKLKLIVNDGRNHLLLSDRRYSLIVSDATNPVSFDAWTLYTKEFYELCRARLADGGRLLPVGSDPPAGRRAEDRP